MTTTYKTSEGRGHWVKNRGYYETNAFDFTTDEHSYGISVTKEGNRWVVFAEDHEPSDIDGHPENGFKSLAEAKEFAEAFGETFETAYHENNPVYVVSSWGEAIASTGALIWYDEISKAVAMHWDQANQLLARLGEDWKIVSSIA